jgi:isoquinoline 1-oxidoreductase beta subunit
MENQTNQVESKENLQRRPADKQAAGGVTRRDFLGTTIQTSGAFIIGCLVSGKIQILDAKAQPSGEAKQLPVDAWVRIAPDNRVTIVVSQAEMGQGIMSTLPAVLAEELGADWDHVQLETSGVAAAYRNPRINFQFTGNSESTMSFFELMRQVGASAREMLIAAAADKWRVDPLSCYAEKSAIIHRKSGRKLTFGALAEAAKSKPIPVKPPLKPQSEWKLLGKPLPRVDNLGKVDGSAIFGLDFKVPGMLFAAVRNCPVLGGKLASIDRSSVVGLPGFVDVVAVPGGAVVVGTTYWQARNALNALRVSWDDGDGARFSTDTIMEQYRQAMAGQDWLLVREVGDPDMIQHSYPNVRLAAAPDKTE